MISYNNYNMSNNAVVAYKNGELPITKIKKENWEELKNKIAREFPYFQPFLKNITLKMFKTNINYLLDYNIHHTSKFYNATKFYNLVADIFKQELFDFLNACEVFKKRHNFTKYEFCKTNYYFATKQRYIKLLENSNFDKINYKILSKYELFYKFDTTFVKKYNVTKGLKLLKGNLKGYFLYSKFIKYESNTDSVNKILNAKIKFCYKLLLLKKLFKSRYKINNYDNHNYLKVAKYLSRKKFDIKKIENKNFNYYV